MTCCLWASDEEIEQEPDQFDCQNCPVADAIDGLDPENLAAWQMYHQVMSRFNSDMGTGRLLLERLTREMEDEDFSDLLGRLAVIHDTLNPPAASPTRSDE